MAPLVSGAYLVPCTQPHNTNTKYSRSRPCSVFTRGLGSGVAVKYAAPGHQGYIESVLGGNMSRVRVMTFQDVVTLYGQQKEKDEE